MLVEVRPLPEKKWHGKKNKESFARPKTLEVLVNPETGRYNTGMTEEDIHKYGNLLGINLNDLFDMNNPDSYWSSKPAWIQLPNHTTVFDTTKPYDFIKVKNMKASHQVANSIKDWEDGKFPDATHVIFDEAEEVANKATKIERERKANGYLDKMNSEDKAFVVQVLSNKTVRGMTPNFITVEIDDIIKSKPDEFIRLVERGREEVNLRGKILEMADKNILTKEGSSYYYMSDLIGMDFETTVSWFKDPNNSKMKVLILERLEKKS